MMIATFGDTSDLGGYCFEVSENRLISDELSFLFLASLGTGFCKFTSLPFSSKNDGTFYVGCGCYHESSVHNEVHYPLTFPS